jgi:hypothetical protein
MDADQDTRQDTQQDGVPLVEAAERLGLTPETVRKRLQRGSLAGYKRDGLWYVVLPDTRPALPGHAAGHEPDTGRTAADPVQDNATVATLERLLAAKDDELAHLRTLLARRDDDLRQAREQQAEERRRHDDALSEERRIIAGLLARLPQLASPDTAHHDPPEQDTTDQVQPPPPRRRPWWLRWWTDGRVRRAESGRGGARPHEW